MKYVYQKQESAAMECDNQYEERYNEEESHEAKF